MRIFSLSLQNQVVDNNDDLESEDDNDSEPPEASPDEDPEIAGDVDTPPQQDSSDFAGDATSTTNASDKTDRRQAIQRSDVEADDGTGGAREMVEGGVLVTVGDCADASDDGEKDPPPWSRIEWGEGEVGGMNGIRGSGLVQRWGKVVDETAEPPANDNEREQSPFTEEHGEDRRDLATNVVGSGFVRVGYGSGGGRRGGGMTAVAAASAAALRATVEGQVAAAGRGGGGGGGGGGSRRDRRRGSSRAPKTLSLSKGKLCFYYMIGIFQTLAKGHDRSLRTLRYSSRKQLRRRVVGRRQTCSVVRTAVGGRTFFFFVYFRGICCGDEVYKIDGVRFWSIDIISSS